MADLVRSRVTYTGGTIVGPAVSTLFFTSTGSDAADAAAAASKLAAFFAALKTQFCQVQYTFGGQTDIIDSATGDLLRSVTVATSLDSGSASGDALPAANQLNVRWETGVIINSKRVRGHWYMPGFSEAGSNGRPSGAIFANVTGAMPALLAGGVVPVVWHRPKGPHGSIAIGTAHVVSAGSAQPNFSILRSRRD